MCQGTFCLLVEQQKRFQVKVVFIFNSESHSYNEHSMGLLSLEDNSIDNKFNRITL